MGDPKTTLGGSLLWFAFSFSHSPRPAKALGTHSCVLGRGTGRTQVDR